MIRRRARAPATLIEREEELAALAKAFADTQRGSGGVALIGGEAGVGKTSLLRSFANNMGDAQLFWGACEALSTSQPLGPLYDMAPNLDPVVTEALYAEENPARLFTLLLATLQRTRHPVVMIIEDIHWADQATLDLVKFLGRRADTLRLLLIVSHRTDDTGARSRVAALLGELGHANLREIMLAPFSMGAVEALTRGRGQSAAEIYRISGGNPFFVTELLESQAVAGQALPRSIRDAVWARAARLDDAARGLLDLLSAMPSGAGRGFLRALIGDAADSAIDAAVRAGMLAERGGGLRFRHELARHAILSLHSKAEQASLHRRIAAALASSEDADDAAVLGLRLHHAVLAGDIPMIVRLAPHAARHAARLGAHRQAADYLEAALPHICAAEDSEAATIWESWSYEAAIAHRIDDSVIAARHRAIALWKRLGRIERVGHNQRWLSRLHWYRGESEEAAQFIDAAIVTLEAIAPTPELAMCYSVRSQWHMLHEHTEEAVRWGETALALAEELGEIEVRVHALNNIGSALMAAGDLGGRAQLEESLSLALQHDFHEHAARVYTNLAELAILGRDLSLAEQTLAAGIAFDTHHDLDAWLYYLLGCKARLLMDQGNYAGAEAVARSVLDLSNLTLVEYLPAMTVLGRVLVRRADPVGHEILRKALSDAVATGEAQRILPVRLARAEAAWLVGDDHAMFTELDAIAEIAPNVRHPQELGEIAVWNQRAGRSSTRLAGDTPWVDEIRGNAAAAAARWETLGLPYEHAWALAMSGGTTPRAFNRAAQLFEQLGATGAALRLRTISESSAPASRQKPRRGPYGAARRHPLGLTAREQSILVMIIDGASNREIATKLCRSRRTVEHHVSGLLAKLGAENRVQAMRRVHLEPWLLEEMSAD
jgi:DNA-binding CsgD family transcriptional regulator/tetratricopeptide (TPR) repeat protein